MKPRILALLMCATCGGTALAQALPDDDATKFAVPAVSRIDIDVTARPDLVGMATPAGARVDLTGSSYRWWLTKGRVGLSLGLGSVGYTIQPAFDAAHGDRNVVATAPLLALGARYQTTDASSLVADLSSARGLGQDRSNAYFGKVGVEWKSNDARWSALQGGLGWHLDSDNRMTVRLRHGVVGVYMRDQF